MTTKYPPKTQEQWAREQREREQAETIWCRLCAARPGEHCTLPNGRRYSGYMGVHQDRCDDYRDGIVPGPQPSRRERNLEILIGAIRNSHDGLRSVRSRGDARWQSLEADLTGENFTTTRLGGPLTEDELATVWLRTR